MASLSWQRVKSRTRCSSGGEQGTFGALLAPQASGAMRLVGDEDADGDASFLQGVGDGSAALVGAEDDANSAYLSGRLVSTGQFRPGSW